MSSSRAIKLGRCNNPVVTHNFLIQAIILQSSYDIPLPGANIALNYLLAYYFDAKIYQVELELRCIHCTKI